MRVGLAQHDEPARPALGAARVPWQHTARGGTNNWTQPPRAGFGSEFRPPMRRAPRNRFLAGLEWIFLLLGLLALDSYIWVNTTATLDQAYSDWAFDQTLRGLKPSIGGFVEDELGWLIHKNPPSVSTPQENAERAQPIPRSAYPLRPGMVVGRLRIPRLSLEVMVREGASESTLRRAVGHIPGTGLPGQTGNVALAGHRDTFFRPLRNIRKDDAIDLDTGHGTLRYLVTSTEIVSPRDVSVLKASSGKTLTLVTCYPFYYVGSAPKRFIVRAVEVQPNGGGANRLEVGRASGDGAGKLHMASRRGSSRRAEYKRVALNHRPRPRPGS